MSTIGLDPEMLVVDGAHRIVPAEKFLSSGAKDVSVAFDNAAIEIRPRESTCNAGFHGNVRECLWDAVRQMRLARRQGKIPRSSEISFIPAARLREKDMELRGVSEFGCASSYRLSADGYIGETTPNGDPTSLPYRSAGYHVHATGWQIPNRGPIEAALGAYAPRVAALDTLIGLLDVQMNHLAGWDEASRTRRILIGYGQAGEFRIDPKNWKHFEYRTLSPWVMSSPMWSWFMVSATRQIVHRVGMKFIEAFNEQIAREEVVQAINEADHQSARRLWFDAIRKWVALNEKMSVRESYRATNPGWEYGHEHEAICPHNLKFVLWALRNGGFTALHMPGWNYQQAWFRAGRQQDKPDNWRQYGSQVSPRWTKRARYDHTRNMYTPVGKAEYRKIANQSMCGTHEDRYGEARHFPSGPTRIFDRKEEKVPEFDEMIGEAA